MRARSSRTLVNNYTRSLLRLKKAGLVINSLKTEKIRVNTITNQRLKLNGEGIKRSSDFCYLGSIVAENGGTVPVRKIPREYRRLEDHSPN
jgi:hypothetical protein